MVERSNHAITAPTQHTQANLKGTFLADYIVSVDAGNGGTKAVLAQPGGGYKEFYEPSVRAIATGESLGLGDGFELQYSYVDWHGSRYVTGDDVIRITRRGLERHMGNKRYGDEFHQFLVANALARMGVKSGTVDLTLFSPPGLFTKVKTRIEEQFLQQRGNVEIKMKGDESPRQWRYSNLRVLPEGIGAAVCFIIDEAGNTVDKGVLEGETVILDVGAYTLDALKLRDGNFNPESLEYATWENAGVNTHVREPLLRLLHKRHDDFTGLTVDDIDALLRRAFDEGDYTLRVASAEMDLREAITALCGRYADWMSNTICDGVYNGFRGIKSVIVVGGGASLVVNQLREVYGTFEVSTGSSDGKIMDPSSSPLTEKSRPVDMNAVGGLRFALMQQKQNAN
jgi:hypothetical protein